MEEPPAKLLDDLFRKTKSTPCIYWLPLTTEQVNFDTGHPVNCGLTFFTFLYSCLALNCGR